MINAKMIFVKRIEMLSKDPEQLMNILISNYPESVCVNNYDRTINITGIDEEEINNAISIWVENDEFNIPSKFVYSLFPIAYNQCIIKV